MYFLFLSFLLSFTGRFSFKKEDYANKNPQKDDKNRPNPEIDPCRNQKIGIDKRLRNLNEFNVYLIPFKRNELAIHFNCGLFSLRFRDNDNFSFGRKFVFSIPFKSGSNILKIKGISNFLRF